MSAHPLYKLDKNEKKRRNLFFWYKLEIQYSRLYRGQEAKPFQSFDVEDWMNNVPQTYEILNSHIGVFLFQFLLVEVLSRSKF